MMIFNLTKNDPVIQQFSSNTKSIYIKKKKKKRMKTTFDRVPGIPVRRCCIQLVWIYDILLSLYLVQKWDWPKMQHLFSSKITIIWSLSYWKSHIVNCATTKCTKEQAVIVSKEKTKTTTQVGFCTIFFICELMECNECS